MRTAQILVVDDSCSVLRLLQLGLKAQGYEVTTAESGEAALRLLQEVRFDLVVTDLQMGTVDGLTVLRRAKELDPTIQVIIHTAHGGLESAIEAIRGRADDYLVKSSSREELHFRVRRCLENQERARTLQAYETILPVCMFCKKIRDDTGVDPGRGEWQALDAYIATRTRLEVSHGCCPDCVDRYLTD